MDQLYNLYLNTLNSDPDSGSYRASSIKGLPHRVGCSNENYPMLFIECSNSEQITDIKLSLFRVMFNRKCSITDIDTKTPTEKEFTIIQMVNDNRDMIKYFFQVIGIVLKRLPINPQVKNLKAEITKIIEIFTLPPKFSKEIVRGLWAELLIIEQSSNPDYLIKAWHEQPEERYDFNDSNDKIEVKSTSGDQRTHLFSLEQLNPNKNSKLIIASVFVNPTGIGKSIFDLIDMISVRITNNDCILKLHEIVLKTIGLHSEECKQFHFDYTFAVDTLNYYNSTEIPSIDKRNIPPSVTSVHFRSDLTNIGPIDVKEFDKNSQLFKSL